MRTNRLRQVMICCVFGVIGCGLNIPWAMGQSIPVAQGKAAKGNATWIDPATVRDAKAREAVGTLQAKLTPIKGYTASLVGSGFSPNGGLQPFPDEQWVRRPDHMLVKRKASSPYNGRLVMTLDVTILVDGSQCLTHKTYVPLTPEQRKIYDADLGSMLDSPSLRRGGKMSDAEKAAEIERSLKGLTRAAYTKIDLATVSRSIPDFNTRTVMANLNNLLDPFASVKMESLKIAKETPELWVFQAEMKQPIPVVKAVLMTFNRQTGFLSKIQWEIDMMGTTETRTTLQVNKVTPVADLSDSLFKMDVPPENLGNLDGPLVSDDTESTIEDYRMNKEVEAESRKAMEAEKKGTAGQK